MIGWIAREKNKRFAHLQKWDVFSWLRDTNVHVGTFDESDLTLGK